MLAKVEIGGTDVTSYIVNYEDENVYGDAVGTIEVKVVNTIADAITLIEGATIEVWRGWTTSTDEKCFSGYIEKYEPDGGLIKLVCNDKAWDLLRNEVTHVYDATIDASAGKISDIFIDLVTNYAGLNADNISVQDSGTVLVLDKFVCNHASVFDRCKALATALDWQFYYRADTDKVYFEAKGFATSAVTLTVGSNVISIPKWDYDITEMINDLNIVGAYQLVETTEAGQIGVTTGYATTGIDLTFTPTSVKVYGDASNPPTTLLVGGLPSSTATYDYYVDKNQKKIVPAIGTTFTASDFYEIRYSHAVPIPVHSYNNSSILTYGTFTKTLTFTDLRGVDDAEARSTNILMRYSTPFIYITLKVKSLSTNNFRVGQMVSIVDNVSNPTVSRTLTITRHRIRYPADYEELDVGDKIWRMTNWQAEVEEKFKRLFENELQNTDLVIELITVDNTLISPIKLNPRYLKVLWNVPFIQQYLNIYDEYFYTIDFRGDGTSATWTTDGKCRWY